MTIRDWTLRLRALIFPRRVERELQEELAFHVERETERLVQSGLTLDDARARAKSRFGSAALAADQCRDERKTGFIDTTVRDVRYAFRTFRRAPLAAITIVSTVALGLGIVTVVYTLLNVLLFHKDAVRNPDELFAVERPRQPGSEDQIPFTRLQYDALRRETTVFTDVVGVIRGIRTRIDGHAMGCNLVSGNFFQVLGVNAALGRPLIPSDDDRSAARNVIVLSHSGWTRRFAADPAVVGRTVLINGDRFEIVGVAPEGFRGLAIGTPSYWAPLSLAGKFLPGAPGHEDDVVLDVIGRLKPGLSVESAAAGITVWASAQPRPADADAAPVNIKLEQRQGTAVDDLSEILLVFLPLFFAFGLILMIACANVTNLLLARGFARQREIGTRLSLGASRGRIVRQLLTESLLLALASAVLGYVISRLALEATVYAAMSTMAAEIADNVGLSAPAADWRVALFLLAGAAVSTMFFGLTPALQTTRLDLVRTLRGEVGKSARPKRTRNALITTQIGASSLLLISAAVFLRSGFEASSFDPGLRISDTVAINIATEAQRAAIVDAVKADPAVVAVAVSSPSALSAPMRGTIGAGQSAQSEAGGYRFVSPEYFDVLDIRLIQGRTFTASERTADAGVVVVSETTARDLWPGRTALNQPLWLTRSESATRQDAPPVPPRAFTVIGVVRDVPGPRFGDWPRAGVYLPTGPEAARTTLTLRVLGNPDQVRAALFERLTAIDPPLNEISTLRLGAKIEVYLLGIAFWVSVVLAALALALTLSGLFSVLSFIVEQRTKEIGVRMALGATPRDVTQLVLRQLIGQIGVGLIAGGVLAAAVATVLLSTPLAALAGGVVHIFDPVAYGASTLCIVTACLFAAWVPVRRAARIDPMRTLRQD